MDWLGHTCRWRRVLAPLPAAWLTYRAVQHSPTPCCHPPSWRHHRGTQHASQSKAYALSVSSVSPSILIAECGLRLLAFEQTRADQPATRERRASAGFGVAPNPLFMPIGVPLEYVTAKHCSAWAILPCQPTRLFARVWECFFAGKQKMRRAHQYVQVFLKCAQKSPPYHANRCARCAG